MIQTWKAPHIIKGILTCVPGVNAIRARRAATGGSNSVRYCYAVWMRHLTTLARHGFEVRNTSIGELGPGDSIGTGLAGMLAGARRYVGLDVVPYSAKADLNKIVNDLADLYRRRAPIPDHDEFPGVRPRLSSYDFPAQLVDMAGLHENINRLKAAIAKGVTSNPDVSYKAPWNSIADVESGSLDLIFSQGVLQCVDDLDGTYLAMYEWLRPGGFCSHSTGFGAIHFSPYWNGHWAYSDLEWRLLRGRREWLLNRQPLSTHLELAKRAGFEVLSVEAQHAHEGLSKEVLSPRFRQMSADDLSTRGAMMVLRKPAS